MNKFRASRVRAIGFSALAAALLFSAAAFARTLPENANVPPQGGSPFDGQNASGAPSINPHSASSSSIRLQGGKLRACQARENGIKKRSTQLADLAQRMEGAFDAIAGRVEDYYTNTVAPSSKTVANYSNLVSDIAAKKAAVQTALAAAQNYASGFSCAAADPKGTIVQYNTDMKAVRSALQGYRTSIKNLIVAVHSVTGTENSSSSAENGRHPNASSSASGTSQ